MLVLRSSFVLSSPHRKPEGIWPTISRSCAQAQLFKAGPLLDRTIECVMANDYRVTKHGTRHGRRHPLEIVFVSCSRSAPAGVDLLVSDCARQVGGTVYENIPHLFQVLLLPLVVYHSRRLCLTLVWCATQHIGIHSSSSVKRKQQDHHAWIPHMSVYFEEGIDAPAHKDLMDFVNSLPDEEALLNA
jgi:hypothetical protein